MILVVVLYSNQTIGTMNTYYNVIGTDADGYSEKLYGSFDKAECKSELDIEKDGWKQDGYRKFKIVAEETTDKPAVSVYGRKFVKEYNKNHK